MAGMGDENNMPRVEACAGERIRDVLRLQVGAGLDVRARRAVGRLIPEDVVNDAGFREHLLHALRF